MTEPDQHHLHQEGQAWYGAAAGLAPVFLGAVLRLRYALGTEAFVDEPTTLMVAQAIARTGQPILPSGLFYGNDLPYSYTAGGLVALLGPNLTALRLFSVLLSVLTLALVYRIGRRLDSPWTGFWAATILALMPEATIWGGRARAYSLLGLLTLLAVWLTFRGLNEKHMGRYRLGLFFLALSLFVHPEAVLLLPAVILGAGLIHGWRWCLSPARVGEFSAVALFAAVRYGLQLALARGQIAGLDTIAGSRPPLQLGNFSFLLAKLRSVAPFFLASDRIPWTILAAIAGLWAVWSYMADPRKKQNTRTRAVVFVSLCLWLPPVEMILVFGPTYASPRYLIMLLPFLALLASSGMQVIMNQVDAWLTKKPLRATIRLAASVALLVLLWPGGWAAAHTTEKGFGTALEYVRHHRQLGDRVATVAPAYCLMILEQCDYFALGIDYEEFVYMDARDQQYDRWLGSPHIQTATDLQAALSEAGRLWLITDEGRLRKRFEPEFAQLVWQRMDLAAKSNGVMVFVSQEPQGPAISRSLDVIFGSSIALTGYDLGLAEQAPNNPAWGNLTPSSGEPLPLILYWQATGPIKDNYTVFLHLVGPDGQPHQVLSADAPPLQGLQPMTHWIEGETLYDRHTLILPEDLEPGRYRIEAGLYHRGSGTRLPVQSSTNHTSEETLVLDTLRILDEEQTLPQPQHSQGCDLLSGQSRIRLLGYSLPQSAITADGTLNLTLYWQALEPVQASYTVLVHALDKDEELAGQGDGLPLGGWYPTNLWDVGEVVADPHTVTLDAPAMDGTVRLAAGLYLLSTGERLSCTDGNDDKGRILLGEVIIP